MVPSSPTRSCLCRSSRPSRPGRLRGSGTAARCRRASPTPDGNIKTSAAWLIDKAGFGKGYGLPGPAALSTKHTLAITNRGGAKAVDVADLARELRDGVRDTFGVTLVNEPVFVGHSL